MLALFVWMNLTFARGEPVPRIQPPILLAAPPIALGPADAGLADCVLVVIPDGEGAVRWAGPLACPPALEARAVASATAASFQLTANSQPGDVFALVYPVSQGQGAPRVVGAQAVADPRLRRYSSIGLPRDVPELRRGVICVTRFRVDAEGRTTVPVIDPGCPAGLTAALNKSVTKTRFYPAVDAAGAPTDAFISLRYDMIIH